MPHFIMDLEWNTPRKTDQQMLLKNLGFSVGKHWPIIQEIKPFSLDKRIPMRYEIIEFAAISTEAPSYSRFVYSALVLPSVYSELQARIVGLTGHTLEKLKLRGKNFGKVWHNFCKTQHLKEVPTFLIWSFSDAEILFENLCYFENKSSFDYVHIRFVDLQYLFSRYIYHFSRPLSLQRALEIMGLYVPQRLHTAQTDTFSTKKVYDAMLERLGQEHLMKILEQHALSYQDIQDLGGFSYVHKAQEQSLQQHSIEYRFRQCLELISFQKQTLMHLDLLLAEPLDEASKEQNISLAEQYFFEYLKKQKQFLRLTTRHLEEKNKSKMVQKAKNLLIREGYKRKQIQDKRKLSLNEGVSDAPLKI